MLCMGLSTDLCWYVLAMHWFTAVSKISMKLTSTKCVINSANIFTSKIEKFDKIHVKYLGHVAGLVEPCVDHRKVAAVSDTEPSTNIIGIR